MDPMPAPGSPEPDLNVPRDKDDAQMIAACPVVVSASSVVPACPVNGPPGLTVQPATAAGELPAPSVKAPAAAAKSSRAAWDDATSRIRAWLRPRWRRVNASPGDKTVVPEPACARRLAGGGGRALGGDSGGMVSVPPGQGEASSVNAACTRGHHDDSGSMTSKCPAPGNSSSATSSPATAARSR